MKNKTFAMCAVTLTGTAQTKVIAHRGYWKRDRTPFLNSLIQKLLRKMNEDDNI